MSHCVDTCLEAIVEAVLHLSLSQLAVLKCLALTNALAIQQLNLADYTPSAEANAATETKACGLLS